MAIEIIRGTDRQFTVRVTVKSSEEPKDLTGLTGTRLALQLPTENDSMTLSLTPNANGSKLEITSALGGKILVTLSDLDTVNLKAGSGQNMELTIKEGAGPDFTISRVQFAGQLLVKKSLFEA